MGLLLPTAHYTVAWIAAGSILLHVAVKLPVIRRGLTRLSPEPPAAERRTVLDRRAFLRTTALTTMAAALATAGGTIPLLRNLSPLAGRSDRGPQGLPVNRTAAAAGVIEAARDPAWRLEIMTSAGSRLFTLAELSAMPQTTAQLPIACVEGWSASATWTGVRVADLLRAAGSRPGATVRVESLERNSAYATSTLPGEHTADESTLLALRVNGEVLHLDHGYPCRIIAPSRPGVLQTKWVHRIEVL